MPALTILAGDAPLTNRMVTEISRDPPADDGTIVVYETFGQFDFKIQLDLWCATKRERSDTLGKIMSALSPTPGGAALAASKLAQGGVNLQLTNYYNEFVNFVIDRQRYVDNEAGAQRQERRATVELLANCRAIRSRTYYAISHVEVDLGVGENIDTTDTTTKDTTPIVVAP